MTYTVRVSYAKRGDWFMATSADLQGLFVANPSLGVVHDEVPDAIKLLFKVKLGIDVTVKESSLPEKRSIEELVYTAVPMAA